MGAAGLEDLGVQRVVEVVAVGETAAEEGWAELAVGVRTRRRKRHSLESTSLHTDP